MNQARPRIDLDGVALFDPDNPHMVVAIFRYRTTEGLLLLIPESADLLVPWTEIEKTVLDLRSGLVHVRFREGYVAAQNWLRGARELSGTWTDRVTLARTEAKP
ncbi:MAG TPA: hypothetical protein VKN99_19925 [Polyangia bacterium]|nr:hypothetical protein [Polyangia bacterium]